MRATKRPDVQCAQCGKLFSVIGRTGTKTARFCSRACFSEARLKTQPAVSCANCGQTFHPKRKTAGNGKPYQFCSRRCFWASTRGGSPDKLLIACDYCGKTRQGSAYELQLHEHHFCNRACKGKWTSENLVGDKATNWKGGVETISQWLHAHAQMRQWARAVLEAANHSCERCGQPAEHAHHRQHVEDLLALIFDPANGEALCASCHRDHHT